MTLLLLHNTIEKAIVDHDNNLHCFLKQCQEIGVRLKSNKVQLKKAEVPLIAFGVAPAPDLTPTFMIDINHKLLASIVLKLLNSAPTRLQQMLLKLQRYCLEVRYKKGKHMYTADTLSCAHLPDISTCEFSKGLEEVDQTHSLSVSKELLHKIMQRSTENPVFIRYLGRS